MKQLEINTPVNSQIGYMNTQLASAIVQSQITANIINDISSTRRKIKPWRPAQLCQYPFAKRTDDFNVSRGLGSVSLKPCIDSLNNFKTNCINAIKTKFQAMGPENAKDSKLAAGSIELIAQVLQAAKCFSETIKTVNNLISSYMQAIDTQIASIVKNINTLTQDISTIKRQLTEFPFEITNEVIADSLSLLNRETDIATMLVLVGQIQKEIAISSMELTTLANSPEKILLHLEALITLLQGSLQNLQYALSFKSILSSNKVQASNSMLVDDFLDDFNFSDAQASSYNWSITNSNALLNYNTIDEKNLIPQLTKEFQNYTTNSAPILIDSSSQKGTIVVPDGTEGLISVGIDSRLLGNVGIILQLIINKGQTVVIAESYGLGTTLNPPINLVTGKYYNKSIDSYSYNRIDLISGSPNSCKLYNLENNSTSNITVNDYFYIKDDIFVAHNGYYQVTGGGAKYYAPILYKVINVEHNCIEVIPVNDTDFTPNDFYPNLPPGNTYDTFVPSIDPYTLLESINSYNPSNSIIQQTLYKYTFNSSQIPHAGEKIKCDNWQLYIVPTGSSSEVKNVTFSQSSIVEKISLLAIKARWGFIPDQS